MEYNNKFFMVVGYLNAVLGAFGMFVVGAPVFPIVQFMVALLSLSVVEKE